MDMEFSDYDLAVMLDELVDSGVVDCESPAFGVARQCLERGYESLSPAQRAVYDRHIAPHLTKRAERRAVEDRRRGMPD